MRQNEDRQKPTRRKSVSNRKNEKHFFDDDNSYKQKLNKQFKQKKKEFLEESDDWRDWEDNQ